jgi:NAD+-dependent protein deacetylase SIR2
MKRICDSASPSSTHNFFAKLCGEKRVLRWYTQNIDWLEVKSGLSAFDFKLNSDTHFVIPLHGNLQELKCTFCGMLFDFEEDKLKQLETGHSITCDNCHSKSQKRVIEGKRKLTTGFLRPNIVLYNEPHSNGYEISDIVKSDIAKNPSMLVVVGTSLKISGLKKIIKELSKNIHSREGTSFHIIYINTTPTASKEWEGIFDLELIGECDKWIELLKNHSSTHSCKTKTPQSQNVLKALKQNDISTEYFSRRKSKRIPVRLQKA